MFVCVTIPVSILMNFKILLHVAVVLQIAQCISHDTAEIAVAIMYMVAYYMQSDQ